MECKCYVGTTGRVGQMCGAHAQAAKDNARYIIGAYVKQIDEQFAKHERTHRLNPTLEISAEDRADWARLCGEWNACAKLLKALADCSIDNIEMDIYG